MLENQIMTTRIREYSAQDAEVLNRTVLQAFRQFSSRYNDWDSFCKRIGSMSSLAAESEIIVAETYNEFSGAVAYYAPGKDTTAYFPREWASIRLLVVNPASRGEGVGRALMNETINRANRDSAQAMGLHTSEIMVVALSMYLRMGFKKIKDIPEIHGVPYAIYKLPLRETSV